MPSKIEWTQETWNPIRARNTETGKLGWHCVHVSEGCRNCYAGQMNGWRGTGAFYLKNAMDSGRIELFLDEKALLKPLRKKNPTTYFPCSMTDMYADFVPDSWLDKIAAVEALTPQHTYQHLTKRPERMAEYMMKPLQGPWAGRVFRDGKPETNAAWNVQSAQTVMLKKTPVAALNRAANYWGAADLKVGPHGFMPVWPLPNVWLGVSVEDQATADERIPHLLNTLAAVRFVSYEPALGPVDFTMISHRVLWTGVPDSDDEVKMTVLRGFRGDYADQFRLPRLDWIICGGESGPNARPMHPDWARSVRDHCAAAGVPFFFKQWGAWAPANQTDHADTTKYVFLRSDGKPGHLSESVPMVRVGKKRARRLLDGVEHNAMPERRW